jgi:hypothetical protein
MTTTHPVPDLLIHLGPGFLTAALTAQWRAEPEQTRLTLPGTGHTIRLSEPKVLSWTGHKIQLQARMDYDLRNTEKRSTPGGTVQFGAQVSWREGELTLHTGELLYEACSTVDIWGLTSHVQDLGLVLHAVLRDTWSVSLLTLPDGVSPIGPQRLAVTGGGRAKSAAPPEVTPSDVSLAASAAGLRRLATRLKGQQLAGAPITSARPKVAADGLHLALRTRDGQVNVTLVAGPHGLTTSGASDLVAFPQVISPRSFLPRFEISISPGDVLHDVVHEVTLSALELSLNKDGLLATTSARATRSRRARPVTLTDVITEQNGELAIGLTSPDGNVSYVGVARASSAKANGALAPLSLSDELIARLDPEVVRTLIDLQLVPATS